MDYQTDLAHFKRLGLRLGNAGVNPWDRNTAVTDILRDPQGVEQASKCQSTNGRYDWMGPADRVKVRWAINYFNSELKEAGHDPEGYMRFIETRHRPSMDHGPWNAEDYSC